MVDVYCVQWMLIVIVHIKHILCTSCPFCTMYVNCDQWTFIVSIVVIVSIIRPYYAHCTKSTKVKLLTNRCRVGVYIVNTKMDTMNIHCVHNTCPLYSNGLHRTSVDSDGYQRTPVDSDGFQWTPKDFNGVSRDPVSSELRRTPSDSDGLFRQNPTGSDEIVLIPTGVHFITKIFL